MVETPGVVFNFMEPFFLKQKRGFRKGYRTQYCLLSIYVTAENLDEVIKSLEEDSIKLFQLFSDNQMKANHDKCHILVSGKNNVTMSASGFKIKNTECEKLLEIKVDCGLKFENYLDGVIKKASNKINALSRVTPFMNLSKKNC